MIWHEIKSQSYDLDDDHDSIISDDFNNHFERTDREEASNNLNTYLFYYIGK